MKAVREVFLVETMMEEIARGPEPEPGIELPVLGGLGEQEAH